MSTYQAVYDVFPGTKPVLQPASIIGGVFVTADASLMPPIRHYQTSAPAACEAPMCAAHPHYTLFRRVDGRAWCPLALRAEWMWNSRGITWVKPRHFRLVQREPKVTHRMCIDGPLNGEEVRYQWRAATTKGKEKERRYFIDTIAVHHVFAHAHPHGGAYWSTTPVDAPFYGVYVLEDDDAFHYRPEVLDGTYREIEPPEVPVAARSGDDPDRRKSRFRGKR